ncbi:MAG: YggT family protein [Alphaproteobacteria bacterium]|nr:YggT family protein [Alphaproteobacteria bacterium]
MDAVLGSLVYVVLIAIDTYMWIVIISVIVSWLLAFNVVNRHNRAVYVIADVLARLTEPVLRPIRRFLPDLGNIDLSPLVLILILIFTQQLLVRLRL